MTRLPTAGPCGNGGRAIAAQPPGRTVRLERPWRSVDRLLLQVASDDDADMMWGDVGQLYYLVRDAEQPEEALFTWQCG